MKRDEKIDKRLDKQIVEQLREELNSLADAPYQEGAWESFRANSTPKPLFLYRYRYGAISAVAATLLLLLYITFPKEEIDKIDKIEKISVITPPQIVTEQVVVKQEMIAQVVTTQEMPAEVVTTQEVTTQVVTTQEMPAEVVTTQEVTDEAVINQEAITEEIPTQEIATQEFNRQPFELEESKKVERKEVVRFGVNLSPGFNASSIGEGGAINYSGGVTLGVKIAKNVELSTGVQIEHNNLGESVERSSAYGSLPVHQNLLVTNLDIPLNLTWRFYSQKEKSFYLSGGLSSLAYLSEKQVTNIANYQVVASSDQMEQRATYRVESVESREVERFHNPGRVDFAGRVNLMFGVEQRLSDKLNLHIEPFLKIPLTGLTSQKIKFTTGGVTFKVSF